MKRAWKMRGRGAGIDPQNRHETRRADVEDDELERSAEEHPDGVAIATRVIEDRTRSVLNPVSSPDLPFSWSVNPYRGCEHGCSYCYARTGHEDLGYSAGIDFESIIIAKTDAPALLREELRSPKWRGEVIALGGVTDAWQPVEKERRITRACMELFAEARQAVTAVTKSRLVLRDLDCLEELARYDAVSMSVSVTTLDAVTARKMEPRAAAPEERLNTITALAAAGIPVTVMVAPVIPGLTDHEIPEILERAAAAGATNAGYILLRLPGAVETVFREWLEREFPGRARRVEARVRECRAGAMNDGRFGRRHVGSGEFAAQIAALFDVMRRKRGLDHRMFRPDESAFRNPRPLGEEQLDLFADLR